MKKSLFLKQFLMYMTILFCSFILLGVVFSGLFKSYFIDAKKDVLLQHGERLARQYADAIYTGVVDARRINDEFDILNKQLHATTFFVNNRGIIVMGDNQDNLSGISIDEALINELFEGKTVVAEGNLGGLLTEPNLTVGYPIIIHQTVVGGIVMNVGLPEMQSSLYEVYQMITFCLCVCGLIAFITLYFSVKKITNPLIQMNEAAKVIAGGDFEKRIAIASSDEVGQLAESFNHMAMSLFETEQNKKDFLSNISHDLRSPLTSIKGFVNAMQDGTIAEENFSKYLTIVGKESERLIQLTNHILDINKLDNQEVTLTLTQFDLNALIRLVLQSFEAVVCEKELTVTLNLEFNHCIVEADKEKIQRVLYNLMDNAVKFTEAKKTILVQVGIKSGLLLVEIKDEGVGISETQLRHIFDRFYKADTSRGCNKVGSGLGLSIVKQFLLAHGEDIMVTSKVGEGTSFSFSLPMIRED